MSYSLLLFDVRADPVNVVSWGVLILLLVVVFILAVGFVAAMVALLIWLKRRLTKEAKSAIGKHADVGGFDDIGLS